MAEQESKVAEVKEAAEKDKQVALKKLQDEHAEKM